MAEAPEGFRNSDTGMDWKITQQRRKAAAAKKNARIEAIP